MATSEVELSDYEKSVLEIAREYVARGPGFAQERPVLREAAERLRIMSDLDRQQRLLTSWHRLFQRGLLSWGFNVDNPNAPWFHIPRQP